MALYKIFEKDPLEILDYKADFAGKTNAREDADKDYLAAGETIVDADVISSSPGELIVVSSAIADDGTTVLYWLSGGVLGNSYSVTVHATTSEGRQVNRAVRIVIVDR